MPMACAAAEGGLLRVHDLSLGGLLAWGRIVSRAGDAIDGRLRVPPAAGEREVSIHGTIVHIVPEGSESIAGIKIESFDSFEGEKAYKDYVRELYRAC